MSLKQSFFLTVDVGTTQVKLRVWNKAGEVVWQDGFAINLSFPHEGWVELDPEEVFTHLAERIERVDLPLAGMGISNQRETTVVWEKDGRALYPAIVWQDRRTAEWCRQNQEKKDWFFSKTGLVVDPYFSLSKLIWILNQVKSKNHLFFGTLDSFLIYRLTGGRSFVTDYTNASRTMIFNIHQLQWDEDIIETFSLKPVLFPEVRPSFSDFGETVGLSRAIPILVVMGDQQASFLGQGCFEVGDIKNTYGTGCFLMANCGFSCPDVPPGLVLTLASLEEEKPVFALEASSFSSGVLIEWLEKLNFIHSPAESEQLAREALELEELILIPAFCGLGAPHWDPFARGAILGLTPQVGRAEIVRSALEAVAFQTGELIRSLLQFIPNQPEEIVVDGGMSQNGFLIQFQSDLSGIGVRVFPEKEATSLGVFYLAGNRLGFLQRDFILEKRKGGRVYFPQSNSKERDKWWKKWEKGIKRVKGWALDV